MRKKGTTVTYRKDLKMAKIRLINLRNGRKGWSVPYKMNDMTLRSVAPIKDSNKAMKSNKTAVKDALIKGLGRTDSK